jgi:hypothetical protein
MEATKKIRIVVADDSTIYRNNVCLMIGLQKDMEVVAEAETGGRPSSRLKHTNRISC